MTYIGQQPATTFDAGIQDRFTGLSTNTVTLTHEIAAEEDILVVWNNIVQDKNTYSCGGTGNKTITLGGTLSSSDVVTVYYLNKVMQSVNPTANSVGITELNLSDGSNGQAITTNGSGTLSFSTVGVSGVSSASSSTALSIDANGHVTKPLQPAFLATITSESRTSQNSLNDQNFATEVFDNNADYNTTNKTFTAPVTGRYQFNVGIGYSGISEGNEIKIRLATSNRNIESRHKASSGGVGQLNLSILTDMDASDTAKVQVESYDDASVDYYSERGGFSGYLVA